MESLAGLERKPANRPKSRTGCLPNASSGSPNRSYGQSPSPSYKRLFRESCGYLYPGRDLGPGKGLALPRLPERPFRGLPGGSLPEFLRPRLPVTAVPQSVPAFRPGKASVGAPLLRRSQRSPVSPAPQSPHNTTPEAFGLCRLHYGAVQTGRHGNCAWLGDMPLRAVRARAPRLCQASPAAVRSAGPSEARPAMPVGSGMAGSETPAFRCGGWGEPQPARRALQRRGEAARSGSPRPDGWQTTHTISRRVV